MAASTVKIISSKVRLIFGDIRPDKFRFPRSLLVEKIGDVLNKILDQAGGYVKNANQATTANDWEYDYQTDCVRILRVKYGTNHWLRECSYDDIQERNFDGATGVPEYFAQKNNVMYLSPIPNAAYTLTAYYLANGSIVSSSADTVALPFENKWLEAAVVDGVCAELAMFDRTMDMPSRIKTSSTFEAKSRDAVGRFKVYLETLPQIVEYRNVEKGPLAGAEVQNMRDLREY